MEYGALVGVSSTIEAIGELAKPVFAAGSSGVVGDRTFATFVVAVECAI